MRKEATFAWSYSIFMIGINLYLLVFFLAVLTNTSESYHAGEVHLFWNTIVHIGAVAWVFLSVWSLTDRVKKLTLPWTDPAAYAGRLFAIKSSAQYLAFTATSIWFWAKEFTRVFLRIIVL